MLQRLVLLVRGGYDVRMTMPDADGHDSTESIEVPAAFLVPQVLHPALHEHDRLFVVEKNSRVQELFAQAQDFIGRWAVVLFGLMFECRQFGRFHVDRSVRGSEASAFAA